MTGRTGSPLKKAGTQPHNNSSHQYVDDYAERDLFRGLTERDVEIEHLRTNVVALTEQVAVRKRLSSSLIDLPI